MLASAEALAPGNPLVLSALARAHLEAGASEPAIAALEKLAGALRRSATEETQKALRDARDSARRLQAEHPEDLRPALLGAEFALLSGEYEDGLRALRPFSDSPRATPEVFGLMASLYAQLDRLDAAVQAGKRALQLAPGRPELLLTLAGIYQKARDNESAIRLLEAALADKTAATPELYLALGLSHFNFGSYAKAIANCDRALSLDAKFDRAALLKGRAYARLSNPGEATRWLRKSLAWNAGCDFCRYELATVLGGNGGDAEAEALLRQVLTTNPRNSAAHYRLGRILSARNDAAGAIAEFEAAIAADPDHDSAYYQLSRLYAAHGDAARAASARAAVKRIKEQRRAAAEARVSGSSRE
jgi:tetratricopeptide (TPR) repeat protein